MEQHPDYAQLMRLAQTDAGQKLLLLLRQNGGQVLEQALSLAAEGNYTQARKLLGNLMNDPQAQNLLKALEDRL